MTNLRKKVVHLYRSTRLRGRRHMSLRLLWGVVGQRQLAQNPIIERTRGQGAVRTGVEAHPAVAAQRDSVPHDRWRDHACPNRERARRFFFAEELDAQADAGRAP